MSKGGARILPPSFFVFSAVPSASATQKLTSQCGGALPEGPPGFAGAITATLSRGTGCCGSPPTYPGRRKSVISLQLIFIASAVQPTPARENAFEPSVSGVL